MSKYFIDLISHLTLRKIGLTRIKTLSPPMISTVTCIETLRKGNAWGKAFKGTVTGIPANTFTININSTNENTLI